MTNKNLLKILFAEDLRSDAELAVLELRKEGLRFEHKRVDVKDDFINALNEFRPDIVISDYMMPSFNGLQALKEVKEFNPEIPFILCTGSINEETAVECIKAGATDYVIKEHLTRLPFAVKEALEQHRVLIEKRAAELLLRENEEKLQSIFRVAPVGIGLVVNRVFVEVNDTFCKMTGYCRKELIGKSSELIYATKEEYESDGTEKYRQISEKGTGSVETRFKCKNGEILNILLSSAPLDKDDLTKGVTFTALDITRKKRAEEALLEKDQQLSSIYDAVGDVIYHLAVEPDENFRFISVNHAFSTITGLSEEMVVGKLVNEVIPEPSITLVLGKYRQAIREKSIVKWEETSDYPNGKLIGDVSISPVFDDKGRCTHLVGSVHDITNRKLAEEALQKSQHLFQTLSKVSPVGIFRTDPDGYTNYVNPKYSDLTGLSPEEALGNGWLNAVHPDDKEKLKESWSSDFKSQKKSSAEYRFLRPDGSIVWVMGNAVPEWIDNEIVGYIGTITDITGRKQMEETLRESEEKYRLLIDTANESIIVAQDGLLKFVNKITIELLEGNSELELIGRPFPEFIHPDDQRMVVENYRRRIANETAQQRYAFRVVTRTGIVKWVEINAVLIEWQGKPATLNFLSDVTERKRAEDRLKSSEERLKILFEYAPDAYYLSDLKGNFIDGNIAAEKLMGYDKNELIGKNFLKLNLLSLKQLPRAAKLLIKNSLGQATGPDEFVLSRKDGSKVTVEIITHPVKIKDHTLVLGIARDISERKRADEALIESETKYRQLVTQSPDGIFIVDLSGKFLSVNEAICESLKYTEEELLSRKLLEIVPEKYHQLHKDRLSVIIKGESTTSNAEYEVIGKDGITHFVEVLSVPYYKGNKLVGFQGIARDITERKRVDKLLRESEEKYRRIFENVQDLYYESSIDGTILEVSPSIVSLSKGQYQREDLIGKSMHEFYPDPKTRFSLLSALKEKGLVSDFEIILKNRDGSLIPCSISAKISFDAQGKPEKIIGSMRDITERKHTEEVLIESESSLRDAQEIAKMGSWEWDIITQKTNWSDNYFVIHGFKPTEVKPSFELFRNRIHPDDVHFLDESHANIMKDKTPFSLELRLILPDGTVKWIQNNISPVIEDDKLIKLKGVIIDITERKRTEEIINHERRMLRTLIDNLPDHIYVKDTAGRKVISNTADFRDFGFQSEDEVLGKTDLEIFPFPTGQRGYDAEMEVLSSGKPVIGQEEDFIYPDGKKHWSLSTMIPLIDNTGKINGLVGIGHDITQRKQIEEELIKAKEKAEESDRLKTAFLHNISHEIRTPMNAIVGFSALLGVPDIDEQTRKDYIEVIMQGSNHLLEIITDIIDISNIEANLIKITKTGINFKSTLKSLCNQLSPRASEKKIELVCETEVSDSEAFIITDSTKLTQILSNLMNNAIKFTDKGYVKVSCMKRDNMLEFCVSDTGIGIPEKHHQKIFDRFFQVQSSNSRLYEGTGLGLAISKANVELMGGKIWLNSEPGQGASFYFTIPYEKQVVKAVPVIEKRTAEGSVFKTERTILVAEDIDSNFKLITSFLSGTNSRIIRAVNGKEAVEIALSKKNLDLILMDIKMPVMDGYTAVKLIRETNSIIPIIAQTAYADDAEKAAEYGCNGFISKPFDKKVLLNVLSNYI